MAKHGLGGAKKQLRSVVDTIGEPARARDLPHGLEIQVDVAKDGRGDRTAGIIAAFPADTSFEQIDSVVRPLHESASDLNLETDAAVTFASLVVTHGGREAPRGEPGLPDGQRRRLTRRGVHTSLDLPA